ncbi:MAG: D-sedoheptulose 7-phosphate isomerase [Janthinobacterium lividum]
MIAEELYNHQELIGRVIQMLLLPIENGCAMITETVLSGNKLLIAGNGGSAADAQHIAAEFTGRYVKERKALPAIALSTDTSALTAISNDYGFEQVFARQVEALAQPGDLFLAISTSGNSANILKAIASAKNMNCKVLGLSGRDGGEMNAICDLNIVIPSNITARIQEMHMLIGHIFCKAVDDLF